MCVYMFMYMYVYVQHCVGTNNVCEQCTGATMYANNVLVLECFISIVMCYNKITV